MLYEKSLSAAEVSIFSTVGSVFCSIAAAAANNRAEREALKLGGQKSKRLPPPSALSCALAVILPRHLSVLLLSQVESNMVGQHTHTHTHTPTDDQPFLGDRRKISRQLRYTILWRREKDLDLGVGDACPANELIFAVVVLHKHALRVFM
jgi:hypothetical protein